MKKGVLEKSKKAQFYLIAGAIIIFIIIGLANVNHTIIVKDNQKRTELLVDYLNYEAVNLVDYGYSQGSSQTAIDQSIEELSEVFSNYSLSSSNEEFGLYILYGTAEAAGTTKKINGKSFIQVSSGGVQADDIQIVSGTEVEVNATLSTIFKGIDDCDYVNITLGETTYTTRVSSNDNNFIIILTTSDGLSNYIVNNFNE